MLPRSPLQRRPPLNLRTQDARQHLLGTFFIPLHPKHHDKTLLAHEIRTDGVFRAECSEDAATDSPLVRNSQLSSEKFHA